MSLKPDNPLTSLKNDFLLFQKNGFFFLHRVFLELLVPLDLQVLLVYL